MIRAEIMDLVDVDAVIALFRPVPKVMEVPKFIEKVVDNIVTIPQKYVMEEKTATIEPITKHEVVRDTFGIPLKQAYPV